VASIVLAAGGSFWLALSAPDLVALFGAALQITTCVR
jgi:hypothetical protein